MWRCKSCGEVVEDQFEMCFACGAGREESAEAVEEWQEEDEPEKEEPTGKRKIKDECIFGEYYWMLQNAAGHSQRIYDCVRAELTNAKMESHCHWDLREVRSQGWLTRRRRDLLVIEHDWFHDYHMYIGVRDYGTFLDCCQFLTVEPGFFKQLLSSKISGDATYLSSPKNILAQQDLRAWWEAVTIILDGQIGALADELHLTREYAVRQGRGFLG